MPTARARTSWTWAAGWSLAALCLLAAWFWNFPPAWMTNDDVGMQLQVQRDLNPDLLFSHVWLGRGLVACAKLWPEAPVYAIFQTAVLAVSLGLVFALILRAQDHRHRLFAPLALVAWVALCIGCLSQWHFTLTAGLAGIAAISGMASPIAEGKTRLFRSPPFLIGLLLWICALLLRAGMARLMAGIGLAALAPMALGMWMRQGNWRHAEVRPRLRLLWVFVALLAIERGVSRQGHGSAHTGFHAHRFRIAETPFFERLPEAERHSRLAAAGWTETDWRLLDSFFFPDPSVFSPRALGILAADVPASVESRIEVQRLLTFWKPLRVEMEFDPKAQTFLAWLVFSMAVSLATPRHFARVAWSVVLALAAHVALSYRYGALPDRVWLPLCAFALLWPWTQPAGYALPFTPRAKRLAGMLLALILACVVLPPQVRAVRGALHQSRRAEVLSRETRDLAGAWTRSGARVVVWGGFSWQALRPFDPLDEVRDFHPAMLGVTQQESAWPRLQAWTGDAAVWPSLGKGDPIYWILPGGNMGAERAAWLGDFLQRRAGISLVPREETPPEIPRSGARVLRWTSD